MDGQSAVERGHTGNDETVDILYVDSGADAGAVRLELADSGPFAVEHVPDAQAALDRLAAAPVECVVSEYDLADRTGLSLLQSVRAEWPTLPVVLFTDDGDESVARDAIAADVSGYVDRTPLDEQVQLLATTITTAVTKQRDRIAILDRMTDAFFALDEDWQFTYLNERGREIVCDAAGVDRSVETLVGTSIWNLLPEAVDTEFYERYHEAMASQEPVTFEARYGPLDTWLEVRVYPSDGGLSVYFRDVTERRERIAALEQREQVLEEMYRVASAKDLSFEQRVDRMLSIGREVLQTEYGALSHVEGEDYVPHVTIARGGTVAAAEALAGPIVAPIEWTAEYLECFDAERGVPASRISLPA